MRVMVRKLYNDKARPFDYTRVKVAGYSVSAFAVGCVREGESGRQEHQGPLVPGPWAYAFPLCSVIDNYGGTGAEIARERAAGNVIDAKLGDVLVVDGRGYVITKGSNSDNIELVPEGGR